MTPSWSCSRRFYATNARLKLSNRIGSPGYITAPVSFVSKEPLEKVNNPMTTSTGTERLVTIPAFGAELDGLLAVPEGARGIVVFAHGSGSSRLSPRNAFVAAELQKSGLATLLFDLLTVAEDQDYERRFEIDLLTKRLIAASRWLRSQPLTQSLFLGFFGASTGAAAALWAAAELGDEVKAIVSRGGRPDLAEPILPRVVSPTLLLVGGNDDVVIQLNEFALARLSCIKQLTIIPNATHLFEEPGTLEEVAATATDWFKTYLVAPPGAGQHPSLKRTSHDVTAHDEGGRTPDIFLDRTDAGIRLAEALDRFAGRDPLVLGIPRGGVPVAAAVAKRLAAELDVIVSRKLGAPQWPELAIGAVTSNGGRFVNNDVVRDLFVSPAYLEAVTAEQKAEARQREERFRGARPKPRVQDRVVIIVDDGLATGATMRAAVRSVRKRQPGYLVVAVPCGAPESCDALRKEADEVVCLIEPPLFAAVGQFYENFEPTEDAEVVQLLHEARAARRAAKHNQELAIPK